MSIINYKLEESIDNTYKRKLLAYINVNDEEIQVLNVQIYINDINIGPVTFYNETLKDVYFKKDIYLIEGDNEIKIVVTLSSNEVIIETFNISHEYELPKPENVVLLTNFVGSDDNELALSIGNSDISYNDKNAGENKELTLDMSMASRFFKLIGENSNLYRISKENIPLIISDILKKPLSIHYDYVEKIYDGTSDITSEVSKLILNDGYYFDNIQTNIGEYSSMAFVNSINQRKFASKCIVNANETIPNEIIIENENVILDTVFLKIDTFDGYILLDEVNEQHEFIFNVDEITSIFSNIIIQKIDNLTTKITFIHKDDKSYISSKGVYLKYNYKVNSEIQTSKIKSSDIGCVKATFSIANFNSKNVTETTQLINISDLQLEKGELGDSSHNYLIGSYTSYGKILPKEINANVTCLDKVYDGSTFVPFKIDGTGLENTIDGDDVYITALEEEPNDTINKTILHYSNPDVESNKLANVKSIYLNGIDSKNYYLKEVLGVLRANILPRTVTLTVRKIRLYRNTLNWELDYTINNVVNSDNLTIKYNTKDANDIIVYGGIDADGNSIRNNRNIDILNMFFNYNYNPNYKYDSLETNEIEVINKDKNIKYYNDENRIAQPNTLITNQKRNFDSNTNTLTLETDYIQGTDKKLPFYESKDKQFKLYNGCIVSITNIHFDTSNNKLKNYNFKEIESVTYDAVIEII